LYCPVETTNDSKHTTVHKYSNKAHACLRVSDTAQVQFI